MAVSRVSADSNRSKMAERFAISKNLTAEGVAVPELVQKKVARNEKLIKEKKAAIEKRRAERKATKRANESMNEITSKF